MGHGLRVFKYRELCRVLADGGARYKGRGSRTSHHIWTFDVRGEPREFIIPAHNDGDEVPPGYVKRLRKEWGLTAEDGVKDADFIAGRWHGGK
jgi:hypothetical protein